MSEHQRLQGIFDANMDFAGPEARHDHSYRHMVALAEMFTGWALGGRFPAERSAALLGWAESLERLADEVGPSWAPPEPETLSITQFLARTILGEPTAGRTPHDKQNPPT